MYVPVIAGRVAQPRLMVIYLAKGGKIPTRPMSRLATGWVGADDDVISQVAKGSGPA